MNKGKKWHIKRLCLLLLVVVMLVSCGNDGFAVDGRPKFADPSYQRVPPEVRMPAPSGGQKESREDGSRIGAIDLGNIAQGYVGVNCSADTKAKFRVEKGTAGSADYSSYDYDLQSSGTDVFFPLAMGNGHYSFTIFLNLQGSEYEYFLTAEADVTLENEFVPFLVPNEIVQYTPQSQVVQFSYTLTENASTDLEVVQQVYYWVENNITYDIDKANTLTSSTGYVPDPDAILASKTGICYDYAAVVAAMLRANGIPCQLIMGNVQAGENGTVYHAWNMIYLKEKGWIAVKVPSTPDEWERIDLTFASSGDSSIAQFIGDGSNYFEMSVH